jgi:peptide/nickel transport system permease protein
VPGLFRYIARRLVTAALLVVVAASAVLVLARAAPGDHLSGFDIDPRVVAEERSRLGLDRPLYVQYGSWLSRAVRFDLGESVRYPGRRVSTLVRERARNSAVLGICALIVATAIGIPLGMFTGARRRGAAVALVRLVSFLLLSVPSLVMSLLLMFVAARTGWFPVGGVPPADASWAELGRHLVLPVLALALPVAASLERLQSRAMEDALAEPSIAAALARGIPRGRAVARHAWRLSLTPVLAVYGIAIGTLISGSFVVELVMSWHGLGMLMFDALVARDAQLAAGCTIAGAMALATGVLIADVALAAVDPRVRGAS